MDDRIQYLEKVVGDSADKHAKEIKALKDHLLSFGLVLVLLIIIIIIIITITITITIAITITTMNIVIIIIIIIIISEGDEWGQH